MREIVKKVGPHLPGQTSWRGKKAVVVGRSHNVGLPIQVKNALLDWVLESLVQILLGSDSVKGGLDMTVTLCHRYTPPEDLADAVLASDLVVSAAGVPGIITKEMVKPGAVLVDVGLTRVCHLGKNLVVGDVHREARQVRNEYCVKGLKLLGATHVPQVASLVTPVPGGVGPCTVACLMANTLRYLSYVQGAHEIHLQPGQQHPPLYDQLLRQVLPRVNCVI